MIPIKDIRVPDGNPRKAFDAEGLDELAASIARHGVIEPVILRPGEQGYLLVAGERRLRAAVIAGKEVIPACVRQLTDQEAEEQRLVENVQRRDLTPLEESDAYRRFLEGGRTVQEVAAIAGRRVKHVYERLTLQRLTSRPRDLLAQDVLPTHFALLLARVPTDQQATALDLCFRPLSDGNPYQRQNLERVSVLQTWIDKHIRLNPRSEDTALLFPDLVRQVDETEKRKKIRILHLSTLHSHTDRTEPRPILAQSWKLVDSKKPCEYAKEGVIVLGEGKGDVVFVCAARKDCRKHWPRRKPESENEDQRLAKERARLEADERQRLQALWTSESKPAALQQIAEKVQRMPLNAMLVRWLVQELVNDEDGLAQILGCSLQKLPKPRFIQALVLAIAVRHSWSFERLAPIARRVGVRLTPPRLKGHAA